MFAYIKKGHISLELVKKKCPKLFLLFTFYENKLNLHYKIYFEYFGIFFKKKIGLIIN